MDGLFEGMDAWLKRTTPAILGSICLLLVGLLGVLDYLMGHEFASAVFCFIPVSISAWYAGKGLGLIVSAAAACAWLAVDVSSGQTFSHWTIPIWNGAARFAMFALVALLVAAHSLAFRREVKLARTDALTGLMNRRAFAEEAIRLLDLAASHGHHTSVAYVDVDDFKKVNDRFGHDAGDSLLKIIAQALRQGMRSSDLVGRRGGDEFVLLLPVTDYAGAQSCISSIRERLLQACADGGWRVTFSIGVATFLRPPASVAGAIKIADELMYRAKGAGKNRIVHEIVHVTGDAALQGVGPAGAGGRRKGER